MIKDRKTQPSTAICALFPVILADSLRVESALSLTKYCYRLERHIFWARGAHPRFSGLFMFPLFICTLFIWGNWERNACFFLFLSLVQTERFRVLRQKNIPQFLVLFLSPFHVSIMWSLNQGLFFPMGDSLLPRQPETLHLTCNVRLMGYLIPQPHGLIRKEKLYCWCNEIINWFLSYLLIKVECVCKWRVGGGKGLLDLELKVKGHFASVRSTLTVLCAGHLALIIVLAFR